MLVGKDKQETISKSYLHLPTTSLPKSKPLFVGEMWLHLPQRQPSLMDRSGDLFLRGSAAPIPPSAIPGTTSIFNLRTKTFGFLVSRISSCCRNQIIKAKWVHRHCCHYNEQPNLNCCKKLLIKRKDFKEVAAVIFKKVPAEKWNLKTLF